MTLEEECALEELKLFWKAKRHTWKWVTADELLCKGPCVLVFALLTAAAAAADATLYHGHDTTGEVLMVMETPTSQTRQADFSESIYLPNGLYVDIGTAVTGILVVWQPEPKH